jgi:hypothetical protein
MTINTSYATADIVQAATLKHKGFKLERIACVSSRGVFYFAEVPQDLLDQFDLGQSSVEPIGFNNEIRALTTAIKRMVNV